MDDSVWISVLTPDKYERTRLAEAGVAIDSVVDDASYAFVSKERLELLQNLGFKIQKSLPGSLFKDFPARDAAFHNYAEVVTELQNLERNYGRFIRLFSIGKTVQGRDIWALHFTPMDGPTSAPAIAIMGGHHAREHLSVELPLMLAKHLAEKNGPDPLITELLRTREVFIIPQVNPDGSEFDIATGTYQMWRKNRMNTANPRCTGIDLNRNYGFKWGTGGSSTDPCSDTHMGPRPFSEPETQAVKAFVESNPNIKVLLSIHTYSELILYPWGHKYDPIENSRDLSTHEAMARAMARWNGYKPQQASDLYIASGDTTDWSYGQLGIISFTFELSPSQQAGGPGGGGFYPGVRAIEPTFRANLRPMLYMIDLADDPYRAVTAPQTTLFYGQP